MKKGGTVQWKGRVHVCPEPTGKCPNLCGWVPGQMQVDDNSISARVEWYSKQTKPDCSGFSDEPDNDSFSMKRLIGVSFVPIVPGKYIEVVGAPAVGDQAAQFKAAVRLTARYDAIQNAQVTASADHGSVTLIDKVHGTYEFLADRSGTYELRFEVAGSDGVVFHTDRMRIEIPGIPGVGK